MGLPRLNLPEHLSRAKVLAKTLDLRVKAGGERETRSVKRLIQRMQYSPSTHQLNTKDDSVYVMSRSTNPIFLFF